MQDIATLNDLIQKTIPLSRALQFNIVELSPDRIETYAPLQPNLNLHGTGFAGSQYSLAMLTAWALLTHILAIHNIDADVVAADASIRYKSPLSTDIVCKSCVDESEVAGLLVALDRKGRARLPLNVKVNDAASMQANMVAILK